MREAGVTNVYQLGGGIPKYLEQNGYAHFHNKCFVFNERRAVDASVNSPGRSRDKAKAAQ
ncbi:hypothetical protein [Polaromonas sp.]|uniref:hypothetical protein n=1 Tax=Polaromonas sp. TaxID=1869339 RepID=UPI001822C9FF|nr:hypothetical protein [Polaromonas sp.]NMM08452.1 hypothetical protein [Polaromonas sp.]